MKNLFSFFILFIASYPSLLGENIDSLQSVLSQFDRQKDFAQLIDIHLELGQAFQQRYEHDLARPHFEQALELSKIEKIPVKQFEALHQIGTIHFWQDEYHEALDYLLQAKKIGIEVASERKQARTLSQIAQVYLHIDNKKQALFHQFQARDLSEIANDSVGMAQSYNSLGIIYYQMHRFEEGESYLLKSLEIYRELEFPLNLWSILATLSSAELEQENLDEAYSYCKEAKALAEKNDIRYGIAFSTGTLGLIYLKKGELDAAEHHLRRSLNLLNELGVQAEAAEFSFGLIEFMISRGAYDQAIDSLEQVLQTSIAIGSPRITKEAYKMLSDLYVTTKDLPTAHKYLNQHLLYRDSLEKIATLQQALGAENEFEIQQKQAELSHALEKSNETLNHVYSWALSISWIFFGIVVIGFTTQYRSLSRENQQIKHSYQSRTSSYEILKSNHTGLSELVALISQRFQRPFSKIQSFIELRSISEEDQKLEDELRRIETWFADLSVYSVLGQVDHGRELVDLSQVVGKAISQLPSKHHSSATQIRVQDLPIFKAHPHHMNLLIRHLVQEAIVQAGSLDSDILIQGKELDNEVQVEFFTKNGFQSEEENEIGQAISKAIIDHYDGSIRRVYDPSTGSKVIFTIPHS